MTSVWLSGGVNSITGAGLAEVRPTPRSRSACPPIIACECRFRPCSTRRTRRAARRRSGGRPATRCRSPCRSTAAARPCRGRASRRSGCWRCARPVRRDRHARIDGRRREDDRVLVVELGRRVVVRCRTSAASSAPVARSSWNSLSLPLIARRVDDRLAVGRERSARSRRSSSFVMFVSVAGLDVDA